MRRNRLVRALVAAAVWTAAASVAAASVAVAGAAGAAGSYTADPGSSRLEFTGVQAGAEFKGLFHKFTAAVDFAPESLASAKIDVVVDLGSEDTLDKDRDGTIRGADVFDVAHFPTAHYVTKSFAKTSAGYTALGSLTLHGVTKDVPIAFKFAPAAGGGATLTGTAELKRLDFGVGRGDWKSTEWVADLVKVGFTLNLKAKP
jgi:polyisoprenoid-binding protein YceI